MNQFQIEINVLRIRKGLSMVDIAKSMECNRKTLYRAFNSANPSLSTAQAMCKAVGKTIDEVYVLVKQQEDGLACNAKTRSQDSDNQSTKQSPASTGQ